MIIQIMHKSFADLPHSSYRRSLTSCRCRWRRGRSASLSVRTWPCSWWRRRAPTALRSSTDRSSSGGWGIGESCSHHYVSFGNNFGNIEPNVHTGYPLHRENRETDQKKIPVREIQEILPKHREFGNFAKTKGIVCAQVVNSLILKGKYISIFAAKISKKFVEAV